MVGIGEASRMMEGATKPWANSCKCKTYTYIGSDDTSTIKMCLNCPKAECDNCLEDTRAKKVSKKKSLFEELFSKGLKQNEICEIMRISRRTYYYYSKERKNRYESE